MYLGRCRNCWYSATEEDSLFNHVETPSDEIPWSLWEVEKHGHSYSFKADTGKYIARFKACVPGCDTNNNFAFVYATSPTSNALWYALPVSS